MGIHLLFLYTEHGYVISMVGLLKMSFMPSMHPAKISQDYNLLITYINKLDEIQSSERESIESWSGNLIILLELLLEIVVMCSMNRNRNERKRP